jgi:hypothetical protein
MPFHDLIGTRTQQDVELDRVFADVAEYSIRIMGPTHVENVAHLACRTIRSPERSHRWPSGSRWCFSAIRRKIALTVLSDKVREMV